MSKVIFVHDAQIENELQNDGLGTQIFELAREIHKWPYLPDSSRCLWYNNITVDDDSSIIDQIDKNVKLRAFLLDKFEKTSLKLAINFNAKDRQELDALNNFYMAQCVEADEDSINTITHPKINQSINIAACFIAFQESVIYLYPLVAKDEWTCNSQVNIGRAVNSKHVIIYGDALTRAAPAKVLKKVYDDFCLKLFDQKYLEKLFKNIRFTETFVLDQLKIMIGTTTLWQQESGYLFDLFFELSTLTNNQSWLKWIADNANHRNRCSPVNNLDQHDKFVAFATDNKSGLICHYHWKQLSTRDRNIYFAPRPVADKIEFVFHRFVDGHPH